MCVVIDYSIRTTIMRIIKHSQNPRVHRGF
nr:MAG TPA: hypothetical protein [Caudoviricetes sp.]